MTNIDEVRRLASARLDHFNRRRQELEDEIAAWGASNSFSIKCSIADDRLSWEGRWVVPQLPADRWSLIFSEAVGQLRAALDNTLYYIAEKEGGSASQLKSIHFPAVADRSMWGRETRRIAVLPEPLRTLVRDLQPFNRPEPERHTDALRVLAELNNADKHRIILASDLQPQSFAHRFSVEFEDGARSDAPRVTVSGELKDGEVALHHDTRPHRIKQVNGGVELAVQVVVVDEAGTRWNITSLLGDLGTYTLLLLEQVISAWAVTSG